MGREVRRVPPDWQHPRQPCPHESWRGGCDEAKAHGGECYQPMFDEDAESAWATWQADYAAWIGGEHARVVAEYGDENYPPDEPYRAFCNWHGRPPDPKYYRPKWDDAEATWWQVYQTVSEGTPVTPAFATAEELIDYLATHGDFWDQKRGNGPWGRAAAEKFVRSGWAPSLVVTGAGEVKEPRDGI